MAAIGETLREQERIRYTFELELPEPWASTLCELAQKVNRSVDDYASELLSSEIAKEFTNRHGLHAPIGFVMPDTGVVGAVIAVPTYGAGTSAIALGASIGGTVGGLAGAMYDTQSEEDAVTNALESLKSKLQHVQRDNQQLHAELSEKEREITSLQTENQSMQGLLYHAMKKLRKSRARCPADLEKIVLAVGECMRCKRKPPDVTLSVDRILPGMFGGTYQPENVQCLCMDACQAIKNINTGAEWDFRGDYRPFVQQCEALREAERCQHSFAFLRERSRRENPFHCEADWQTRAHGPG